MLSLRRIRGFCKAISASFSFAIDALIRNIGALIQRYKSTATDDAKNVVVIGGVSSSSQILTYELVAVLQKASDKLHSLSVDGTLPVNSPGLFRLDTALL
jgi:hypothetical protein